MSKGTELANNTLILSVGRLVAYAATFITVPLYTYYLTTEEYGVLDMILTLISLLVPVLTLRLEAGIFRKVTDNRRKTKTKLNDNAVVLSSSLKLVSIIAIGALAVSVLLQIAGVPYSFLIALLLISNGYMGVIGEFIRGLGSNKKYTYGYIILGISTLAFAVVFVAGVKMGIVGAVLALVAANIVSSVYFVIVADLRKYIIRNVGWVSKEVLAFSAPLVPSSIAWWVINASDRIIITFTIGVAFTGIYAVSNKFSAILMVVFPIFSMVLTESAILHINEKDKDVHFSRVFNVALLASTSVGAMILIGCALFFSHIVDPRFAEAYNYIPLLILATIFNNVTGMYGAIYIAKNRTKKIMSLSIYTAALNIVSTVVLVNLFGLYGAAAATALSYGVMAFWRHLDIKKIVRIAYDKNTVYSVILLFGLTVIGYFTDNSMLSYIIFAVVAIAMLVANKSITNYINIAFRSRIHRKSS